MISGSARRRPSISSSEKPKSPHSRADFIASSALSGVASLSRAALIKSGTKWVSGGIVRSGWASSIIRSSVVPERFMPTTNGTGSRRASSFFSLENKPMISGRGPR